MSIRIDRSTSAAMFGPTTGDRVRLGDTALILKVEKDLTTAGDQVKFGGGKVIRDGMGQDPRATRAGSKDKPGTPDLVITNALIIDYTGIYKADIGVRDGKICAIGAAGNPAVQDGITPGLTIGAGTEVLSAEGMIITAGGIDTHIHFISPQQIETALVSGVTTMLGGGTGPATGTLATTCTPGSWNLARMFQSLQAWPMNFGLLGKGNSSLPHALIEQIEAGACGLKLHEDWGTTPAAIDTCLTVADRYKVPLQVAIRALRHAQRGRFCRGHAGRVQGPHHPHLPLRRGAGGGHRPRHHPRYAGQLQRQPFPVRPIPRDRSRKTPSPEHRDMLMVCHHLDPSIAEDVAFADSRIRPQTIAARGYSCTTWAPSRCDVERQPGRWAASARSS